MLSVCIQGPKRRNLMTDNEWIDDHMSNYQDCAMEDEECECHGTVLYGASPSWIHAEVYGTFTCSDDVIGTMDWLPSFEDKRCTCYTGVDTAEAVAATMAETVRDMWSHGTPSGRMEYLEYIGDEMAEPDADTGLSFTLRCFAASTVQVSVS